MEKNNNADAAGMAYLSLPTAITRAASRESFASGASLVSFSSLMADAGGGDGGFRQQRGSPDDDCKTEDESPELAGYREAILERMLESNNVFLFPTSWLGRHTTAVEAERHSQTTPVDPSDLNANKRLKEWVARKNVLSDKELIRRWKATDPNRRRRLLLRHKSLSTTDLLGMRPYVTRGSDVHSYLLVTAIKCT